MHPATRTVVSDTWRLIKHVTYIMLNVALSKQPSPSNIFKNLLDKPSYKGHQVETCIVYWTIGEVKIPMTNNRTFTG